MKTDAWPKIIITGSATVSLHFFYKTNDLFYITASGRIGTMSAI